MPSATHLLFSTPARASEGVSGAVLEDGVGVPATQHCHAHQMCGGWEGRPC